MNDCTKKQSPLGPYRLGIDMGTRSIGWSIILEEDGSPSQLLRLGARRFDAGVEGGEGEIAAGKDQSRATTRREARGPRRQHWRRQHRLSKVFRTLKKFDLLPATPSDSADDRHDALLALDAQLKTLDSNAQDRVEGHLLPYQLRSAALDTKLERHQFGRALYHLAQRRGFLSNRKTAREDDDVGVVKKGIGQLQDEMAQVGARTLGEYFAGIDPEEHRIRARWTARRMFIDEFNAIWDKQATYYDDLTDERKQLLFKAMFDQRPLKSQKHLIGHCELEPTKRKAPFACIPAQQFRIWQKVNDLRVIHPDGEIRELDTDERKQLAAQLEVQGDLSFKDIRDLFGMKRSKKYKRNYEFTHEEGDVKKIQGNRTAAKLADAMGQRWLELDEQQRHDFVDDILSFESEEALAESIGRRWKLDGATAYAVSQVILEKDYCSLSRKAIGKVLPLMKHRKLAYATARKEIYGEELSKTETLEFLPAQHECDLNNIRQLNNPAVARALSELRKIVNAIIKQYGRPTSIHVELARDLKHGRKRREDITKRNKENEKQKISAGRMILEEMNDDERYATETNKLKVRLAEECGWVCPFTGKCINMQQLVGDEPQFDIEHIIPFSRSLDNSFLNKTLCYHEENRNHKRNRTPFEAYAGSSKWDEIQQRVRGFKGEGRKRKLQLFQMEQLPTIADFCQRQLNDTRYMSRLATEYLGLLYGGQIDEEGKRRVRVSPGRVTSYLRQRWNLNSILGHSDTKERSDHRHHAIDAIVIALTGAAEVQLLSRAAAQAEELHSGRLFAPVEEMPWEGFLDDVREAIEDINVSSRVSKKLNGSLHKETILSKPFTEPDGKGGQKTHHHVRKRLEAISPKEVAQIVDDQVRFAVQKKLKKLGGDPKKAFADKSNHPHLKSRDGRIIPIHSARIRKSDRPMTVGSGSKKRYVNPGSNYHVEIIATLDEKGNDAAWEAHVVSRFEAISRKSRGEPVIQRNHGEGKEFRFSLCQGEHVMMKYKDDEEKLYRLLSISKKNYEFILHTDARPSTVRRGLSGQRVIIKSDKTFQKTGARKVTVDPLGNILPAND